MDGPQVRVFDQIADAYDQQVPFFSTFGRRLAVWAGIRPGDRVLDVACGRGAIAIPAREATGTDGVVVAVDASSAMVAATATTASGIGFAVMDARRLALADAAFDVVTCGFALHFIADPRRVLAEARRVLRPGGLLAWSRPAKSDDGGRWAFYDDLVARYEPLTDPAQRFPTTSEPVEQLAADIGFHDIEHVHAQVHLALPDPAAFWAWHQAHGAHALWLALPDDARQSFRRELFDGLENLHATGGIVLDSGARFTRARRP
jgi:ubiquinone/menaquinone biosynthesis C-methylase UbiE